MCGACPRRPADFFAAPRIQKSAAGAPKHLLD
jgi:hypothetical protein